MTQRIIVLAVLSLTAAPTFAGNPRFRGFRRPAPARQPSSHVQVPPRSSSYRHLLDSPEKMTKLFGPSILIREPVKAKDSRFVTQPID